MPGRPAGEAVEDRLHHLVEREPGLGAELGRHAHLGVHDPVGGEVLGALERHPLDRVLVLHHADRVGERLEVEHEVVALGPAVEPVGEIVDVRRGKSVVAVLAGQFDDRGWAQPAVEMVVEQRLGSALEELRRECDATQPSIRPALTRRFAAVADNGRSGISGGRCNQFHAGYSALASMQWRL